MIKKKFDSIKKLLLGSEDNSLESFAPFNLDVGSSSFKNCNSLEQYSNSTRFKNIYFHSQYENGKLNTKLLEKKMPSNGGMHFYNKELSVHNSLFGLRVLSDFEGEIGQSSITDKHKKAYQVLKELVSSDWHDFVNNYENKIEFTFGERNHSLVNAVDSMINTGNLSSLTPQEVKEQTEEKKWIEHKQNNDIKLLLNVTKNNSRRATNKAMYYEPSAYDIYLKPICEKYCIMDESKENLIIYFIYGKKAYIYTTFTSGRKMNSESFVDIIKTIFKTHNVEAIIAEYLNPSIEGDFYFMFNANNASFQQNYSIETEFVYEDGQIADRSVNEISKTLIIKEKIEKMGILV